MHQPDHLVRMRDEVGGKFHRDQTLDRHRLDFAQIHQAARQHMIGNTFRICRIERERHRLRFVPFGDERFDQLIDQRFRAALHERRAHGRDQNAHQWDCVSSPASRIGVRRSWLRKLATNSRSSLTWSMSS